MPVSFAPIFRAVVLLLLTAHVFYMYCTARGLSETFGFRLHVLVIAGLFALAMLLPFVWAVFLPELPEYLDSVVRPRSKWRKGQCPHCGYDRLSLPPAAHACPECGGALVEPSPMRWFNLRSVRRFVAINIMAWIIGCATGEVWMELDERAFEHEVRQRSGPHGSPALTRPRRWPNSSCELWYDGRGGFGATQ